MSSLETIENYFTELKLIIDLVDHKEISEVIGLLKECIYSNNAIYTCGNGGSASTASHLIVDWVKMYYEHRQQKIRAYCFNDNPGVLTAYGNDIEYNSIFSMQVKSSLQPNDLLFIISGSGNSQNVINAALEAAKQKVKTIAFVGYDGGKLKNVCDYCVHIPSFDMQICEDLHLSLGHVIMKAITGMPVISQVR